MCVRFISKFPTDCVTRKEHTPSQEGLLTERGRLTHVQTTSVPQALVCFVFARLVFFFCKDVVVTRSDIQDVLRTG